MHYLNGSCNGKVSKKDRKLNYQTDKMDAHLEDNYPECFAEHCGINNPQRRQKWLASDTYWKEDNIKFASLSSLADLLEGTSCG